MRLQSAKRSTVNVFALNDPFKSTISKCFLLNLLHIGAFWHSISVLDGGFGAAYNENEQERSV